MFRIFISLLFLIITTLPARSADVIGLSLPLQGRFGPVTERMKMGAELAAKELQSSGFDIELKFVDDGCNIDTAAKSAAAYEQAGAKIVVGAVCFKYAAALAKSLNVNKKNNISVITWNTRNPLLKRKREFDGLPLYSLSVAPDAEARAIVDKILPEFGNRPFALIDDGSIYGRSLADSILLLGEQAGIKPVVISNFRPLQSSQKSVLKRLERSGVQAVFIAAAPMDVAIIARDMGVLNYDWMIATGESASLLPFTPGVSNVVAGLLSVQLEETNSEDAQTVVKKLEGTEIIVEPSLLAGYALVEIAAKALSRKKQDLIGETYSTALGTVTFDKDGRAAPAKFILYKWDGGSFKPAANAEQ